MIDIIINEPFTPFARKLYQGDRSRYPSMTDVKFLSKDYIVAAHRYGCKVYIICLQDGTSYQIVDSMTLMYNGSPYQTESFTLLNNTIYMISFSNVLTVIDILPGYRLKQRKSVKLVSKDIPFHGIASRNNLLYVTPSRRQIGTEHIVTYDSVLEKVTPIATLGDTMRVKGLSFLPNDLIVVIINYKTDTAMIQQGHSFDGAVHLYTLDFELLDAIEVPHTHFDCVVSKGPVFYATGADLDGGYIYKGCVAGQKFSVLDAYCVHDFPHGIDLRDTTIAYTSYTTSGIHFVEETELGKPVKSFAGA